MAKLQEPSRFGKSIVRSGPLSSYGIWAECLALGRRGHRSRFTEDLLEQQGKSKFRSVAYIRLLSKVKAEFAVVHL